MLDGSVACVQACMLSFVGGMGLPASSAAMSVFLTLSVSIQQFLYSATGLFLYGNPILTCKFYKKSYVLV